MVRKPSLRRGREVGGMGPSVGGRPSSYGTANGAAAEGVAVRRPDRRFRHAARRGRGMVTSSSTGGSISWARLPVAAKQRIRTVPGMTSRRRKDLKKGGLYLAEPGE